jgi:hypothetical protein
MRFLFFVLREWERKLELAKNKKMLKFRTK